MIAALHEISTIIERDSKDTTYKFALLRASIQATQEYDHYAIVEDGKATFPLGLIVLKWIEYYYAIFQDERFIPQRNGDSPERSLAFRKLFINLIQHYSKGLGYYQFQKDLKTGRCNPLQQMAVASLVKKIKDTVVRMPMHYIGGSINKGGEIFKYNNDSNFYPEKSELTEEYIIRSCGTFSIPSNYYEAFRLLGSFIIGTRSLLFEWADFTLRADIAKKFSRGEILQLLDLLYDKEREVGEIKSFYNQLAVSQNLYCVWSGRMITNNLNIDHMMPYSLWKNNDLWNLLPSANEINSKKKDKIPSCVILNSRKDDLIFYWELIYEKYPLRFSKEIQISLLGNKPFTADNWQSPCFNSLLQKCDYLINQRGFEPFNL